MSLSIIMPKNFKKRRGKKRFYKKKSYPVKVGLFKKLSDHFPPSLKMRFRCNASLDCDGTALGPNSAMVLNAMKASSIINCGPSRQATAAGSFGAYTASEPAGISYILGSGQLNNTSPAPYYRYLVTSCRITVRFATVGATNGPLLAALIPYASDPNSFTWSDTVGNMAEQMYAKQTVIPAVLNTKGISLSSKLSTKTVYGLPLLNTDSDAFTGTYNTNPARFWTWVVGVRNLDLTSTAAFSLKAQCQLDYDIIFFDRNVFRSTVPT